MIKMQIGDQQVEIKPPDNAVKMVIGGAVLLALISAAFSSVYVVEAEEEAVLMRFGKYIDTKQRGLHFMLPFGIDTKEILPTKRQQKQEFGFGTSGASNLTQFTNSREQEEEKQMVSGDLNAALVEWVIQFRITEPKDYLFNVRSPDSTLRDASESVMREVVGDRTVDEVITIGRQEIEEQCEVRLRELVKNYKMGITIDQVQLKDVDPPQAVQASFNEVNQAQQEREQSINEANGDYNRAVPKARGDAERIVSEAEGYALQRVNEAEGDAARFNSLYTEYEKAPEVTKRRIYLETMQNVMPKVGKKVIMDENAQGILPLLNLDSEISKKAK